MPPLQQSQGLAHSRAGKDAAHRGAVHTYLRGIHFPEGTACTRRSDGISAGAFSAAFAAARADQEIPQLKLWHDLPKRGLAPFFYLSVTLNQNLATTSSCSGECPRTSMS